MKILIDTNILFSAILHANSKIAKTLFYANEHHQIFLSDQNIQELREIVRRKAPLKLPAIEELLTELSYEVIPVTYDQNLVTIRDTKDQPILNAAILNDLDIILTGDKDFLSLDLDRPECMTVAHFCEIENLP